MKWILFICGIIGLLLFKIKKYSNFATLCFVVYVVLCILCIHGDAGQLWQEHYLSSFHIWISTVAKVYIVALAIGVIDGKYIYRESQSCGLILQGASILAGMIWAFEDFSWGTLWQWDPIELLSLSVLFGLCAMTRSANKREWACLLLLLFFLQGIMLYGIGILNGMSRHSYGLTARGIYLTIGYLVWVISIFVICFRKKNACCSDIITVDVTNNIQLNNNVSAGNVENILIYIILFVNGLTFAGFEINHDALYFAFIVLWCGIAGIGIFYRRNKRRIRRMVSVCILGVITFCLIWNSQPEIRLETASVHGETWILDGIYPDKKEDCIDYIGTIRFRDEAAFDIAIPGCERGDKLEKGAEIWADNHLMNVRGLSYHAVKGVQLVVEDMTWGRLCEAWLVLMFLLALFGLIHDGQCCLRNTQKNEGENRQKA